MTYDHRSNATFDTAKAGQYLQTICKHFGHKVKTEFTPVKGRIEFPFGRCDLEANQTALKLTASAGTEIDLEKLQNVVGSHLERFAFREKPKVIWD